MSLTMPGAHAQLLVPGPPNLVRIHSHLTTSGQPSAAWLETLAFRGIGAVIYLAPFNVHDAVPDEAQILRRQSIPFVFLQIPFNQPTAEDLQRFVTAMNQFADRNVLVHCQVTMRASSMVFLYRTIINKEDPYLAFQSLEKVWVPDGVWLQFMQKQLREHGILFDLL